MPEPVPRRRGRPSRPEPAEPVGYRVTAALRRQLLLAMAFTDQRTLQAVIDRAVRDYLAHLRQEVPGFAQAVEDAESHVTGRPANVRRLHSDKRDPG